ncbi:hypothetical protein ACQEVG_26475 [Streptomyces sp. CA-135486]|uniref:hypothetical protein n=1 Tax=Streptomyces sp. CA-135486 TaxID=3240049 RepID=UPI003D939296
MRWDNFGIGARALLDPTGTVLPARAKSRQIDLRSFDDGVEALISALDSEDSSRLALAMKSEDTLRSFGVLPNLSSLRLVAVTGSFLSAVLTSVLGALALVSGTSWPIAVISVSSAVATLGIGVFFVALQHSLRQKARSLHERELELVREAVQRMAKSQVEALEARGLIKRSKGDPELAGALLMEIVSEYNEEKSSGITAPEFHSPAVTVEQVMSTASEDHPVVRMLRRLASDVQEAR